MAKVAQKTAWQGRQTTVREAGVERSILWPVGLALAGYIALTIAAMWPAFSNISGTVMGAHQPSDATAGGVWQAWQMAVLPPFARHTALIGFPAGAPFWQPTFVTSLAWMAPLWLFAHLVTPVAAWNIVTGLGFVADGMAMYGLTRWLTGSNWLAFVAGALYSFSPFHVGQSYSHIGYVYSWIFPLIVWAGLALLGSPTGRRAIVFGVLVGVAAYCDGYYIIFAPLVAICVLGTGFALANPARSARVRLLKLSLTSGTTAVVVMVPVVFTYLMASRSLGQLLAADRTRFDLDNSSAHVWEYFVPWSASPIWGPIATHLMKLFPTLANPPAASAYLGTVVVLLAITYAIWVLRVPNSDDSGPAGLSDRQLAGAVLGSAVILTICSFAWFGPVPGLPTILWTIKPFWRAFRRLDVAIDCLIILGAMLGLSRIRSLRWRWLAPAIAVLALVDSTAILPWSSWSYANNTPSAFRWLNAHPVHGVVAGYPMTPAPRASFQAFTTYQAINHHPLFNGAPVDSKHGQLERGLADIDDPQTIPTLRRLGVRYVLLDASYYLAVEWWRVHLKGISLITSAGGVHLYRVDRGPTLPGAITVVGGFNLERPFLPHVLRFMLGSEASLGIDIFHTGIPLRISFHVFSWRRPRELYIFQDHRLVWHGRIGLWGRTVAITTRSHEDLRLKSIPGSQHVHGFGDKRAVGVNGFDVRIAG